MQRLIRVLKWAGLGLGVILIAGLVWYWAFVPIHPPPVSDQSVLEATRKQVGTEGFVLGNNWLKQDSTGLWQLYIEGAPFERGAVAGILCQDLLHDQEAAFVAGIDKLVSSRFYLFFLKHLVAVFTRKLPDYVDLEYQQEIYGIALCASDDFDFIGPKFQRKLNFHAAHDIGHALQTQGLVAGCTMLASIPPASSANDFLVGRNFDFYVGDAFARQKVVTFLRPDSGIPFAMVGWPGMMGAVSGMNINGLAIALNAGPSKTPRSIGTPVTLLARKVLQYASTIEEAARIIDATQIFVSENIIVVSGSERRVVVFEKSPEQTVMYETVDSLLICSNHFQSPVFYNDEQNLLAQTNTSTGYRYKRMVELADKQFDGHVVALANILRNTRGLEDMPIALGSEMSLNQLTAHHSVIFDPLKLRMWVACSPTQLGPYLSYDLHKVFSGKGYPEGPVHDPDEMLPADTLLHSVAYQQYLEFRRQTEVIQNAVNERKPISDDYLEHYAQLNPMHYMTFLTIGDYYASAGDCSRASDAYERGLRQALPGKHDEVKLLEALCDCAPQHVRCH